MAIGLRKVAYRKGNPLLTFQMMRCEQPTNGLKVVKELLGIPWPVKAYVGAALYTAEKLIPDGESKPECVGMGKADFEITATNRGAITVNASEGDAKKLRYVRETASPGNPNFFRPRNIAQFAVVDSSVVPNG